ncbi:MAG: hypothetical protein ACYTFT_12925, partial [Planctomycetota bacterium]
ATDLVVVLDTTVDTDGVDRVIDVFVGQPDDATDSDQYDFSTTATDNDVEELAIDLTTGDGLDYPDSIVRGTINVSSSTNTTASQEFSVFAFFLPAEADAFEANDTFGTASTLTFSATDTADETEAEFGATITANDTDFYAVTLDAEGRIKIEPGSPNAGNALNARILDTDGSTDITGTSFGNNTGNSNCFLESVTTSNLAAGTYFVKVDALSGGVASPYILRITRLPKN